MISLLSFLFFIISSWGATLCYFTEKINKLYEECAAISGVLYCTQLFPCSFTSAKAYCDTISDCVGVSDQNGDEQFTVRCGSEIDSPGSSSWSKTDCQASGCDVSVGEQGFIFFLDYSGSIDGTEWSQMLTFVIDVCNNAIPPGSLVAAAGFGHWRTNKIPNGWITDWTDPQTAGTRVSSAYYGNSGTYLGAGLDWLLNDSPLTWSTLAGKPRTLMIFTDGEASDPEEVTNQRPALDAAGIRVMVVGIGDGFNPDYVATLVQDTDRDIIESANFNVLDGLLTTIQQVTCRANQAWVLSEVKPSGTEKYLEFVTESDFDGLSSLRVTSNLFSSGKLDISNSLAGFPAGVISQGSRVVIGNQAENAGAAGHCIDANKCYYFQTTFSNAYENDATKQDGWTVSMSQSFDSFTTTEDLEPKSGITWGSTFPVLPDASGFGYSFELRGLSLSPTSGANWRRSCRKTSLSIGQVNDVNCPLCEDNTDCNDPAVTDNTCESTTGCSCLAEGYYDGTGTNECQKVPLIASCVFNVETNVRANHMIVFDKVSSIDYYEVTAGGSTRRINSFNYTGNTISWTFVGQGIPENTAVTIKSIGVMDTTDLGNGNVALTPRRWSKPVTCTTDEFTLSPTSSPIDGSGVPSSAPSQLSRYVLLSKGSVDRANNTISFANNVYPTLSIRVAPPPVEELRVGWEARETDSSGTVIQEGEAVFPAYYEDEIIVELSSMTLPSGAAEKLYFFRVKDSATPLQNDREGRMSYTFFSDDGREVQVQLTKYEALTAGSTTEDSIDWWLILIIVCVALLVIGIVGYYAYRYYTLYIQEAEEKRQAIEELDVAEQGIGGFFQNANVQHVQENPLHGDTRADTPAAISLGETQAQMVQEEGDDKFKFSPREFDQRTIGDKRLAKPDSRYRDESAVSMSAHEIDPDSLPNGFQ